VWAWESARIRCTVRAIDVNGARARAARSSLQAVCSLALIAGTAASATFPAEGRTGAGAQGGLVRVVLRAENVDSMDPALAYEPGSWSLIDPTCARLLRPKALSTGSPLVPEVAATMPRVSDDGRTYTFTLRAGFRFSDGSRVRASAFARAIERTLAPGVASPYAAYTGDIVGAGDVRAGRSARVRGVAARGLTLVVRLKHAIPEFPFRTTALCAVPPDLPSSREGVGDYPAAGPYYVSEYRPGDTVVLRRNPFYGGRRSHHVDGFVADLGATSYDEVVDRVDGSEADWGWAPAEYYFAPARRLAARHGVNRSRFFVQPGWATHGYVLNTSRPLFRDNPELRQAVNFAVDRAAHRRAGGSELQSELTDQYLPAGFPGFRDARVYPLQRPDPARARRLARGNTRSGKAVLFTVARPPLLAAAQSLERDLAKIGLDVQVVGIPQRAYFNRLGPTGAYDIGFRPWLPDYADPFSILNVNFDGRFVASHNWGRFDDGEINRALRDAASLEGRRRYAAYAALDERLAREAAPMIAVEVMNDATLVSARVGCVTRPFDLAAVCLKR
jgi:peptide/nickel transport system substrate-binding protein